MDGGDETVGSAGRGEAKRPGLEGVSSIELVQQARAGNREALDRLLARYLPPMRRWASGRLPRWARDLLDTDDMIQEILIKTLRNVEDFVPRSEGALAGYLRQALHNRIRDEMRNATRRPRRDALPEDRADIAASPLEAAIGSEAVARYEAALERLNDDDRELILARIEMDLGYEEIARITRRPTADAARMAIQRALLRLATEMDHG